LLIPGIGPVVAGGILATALGGAAIGAAAGGLLGALTDMGVPEEDARYYDNEFQSGRTIVTVQAGNRSQEAWDILRSFGARDASNRGAAAMTAYDTPGAAATTTRTTQTTSATRPNQANVNTAEGAQKVQLRDEQLTATKQAVEAGEVQLNKVVHEKEQQIPVNLQHEEVIVERRAVDRPLGQGEIGEFTEETISVPVYEEQAQLQKQTRIREEVSINKQPVQEQQTFTGTTRHEHLNVESTGDVDIKGGVGNNVRNSEDQSDQP